MPNRGGRAPSGPWNRLKPAESDPLGSVGLPSKGETRLLSSQFQQRYYAAIVERYLSLCTDAGERDTLLQRFASLEISEKLKPQPPSQPSSTSTIVNTTSSSMPLPSIANGITAQATASSTTNRGTKDLSDILLSLRKLREAMVATSRADAFAVQAYLFAIRLAVLTRQPDAYHPALLHLLRFIHPRHALTSTEQREAASYLVLDAACRRGALAEAFALRRRYVLRDARVDGVLRALAADNWAAFWRLRRSVDGHVAALMEFAAPGVRRHALKAFGRAYLAVGVEFLERSTDESWERLVKEEGVGWALDGSRVVIRKIQAK